MQKQIFDSKPLATTCKNIQAVKYIYMENIQEPVNFK